jgi:hypothetical protein
MIKRADGRWFSYILVKCADEYRDEHLNVGVLVYDSASQEFVSRFEPDLERVERVLPHVRVGHLRMLMNSTFASVRQPYDGDGIDLLASAQSEWRNVLRASDLRSVLGHDAEQVADDLFNRYVRIHSEAGRPMLPAISTPASTFSSRIVVRSLRTRLVRAGVSRNSYSENAQLTGLTRTSIPVPVWYPLQVRVHTFMDGLEIHDDPSRDYDLARLAAQKVEQTLRSMPSSRIAVAIKDPGGSSLGEKVESIIESDGEVAGARPIVFRYSDTSELDPWMAELFRQQTVF